MPKKSAKKLPPQVYMLVGIVHSYIDYNTKRMPLEREASKLHKAQRAGKKVKGKLLALRRLFGKLRREMPVGSSLGTNTMGVFLSKAAAVAVIKKYGHQMHECGYYSHLVIERRFVGLGGHDFDDKSETWFRLNKKGSAYLPCKKPACLKGTVCFSGS